MNWNTTLHGCPSQSYTFVQAADSNYALFLSHRPDSGGWRAYVIPSARRQGDLLQARWSRDLFADTGITYREDQLRDAQAALLRAMAAQLGISVNDIKPARGGRLPRRRPQLTGAQLHQIASIQPHR